MTKSELEVAHLIKKWEDGESIVLTKRAAFTRNTPFCCTSVAFFHSKNKLHHFNVYGAFKEPFVIRATGIRRVFSDTRSDYAIDRCARLLSFGYKIEKRRSVVRKVQALLASPPIPRSFGAGRKTPLQRRRSAAILQKAFRVRCRPEMLV